MHGHSSSDDQASPNPSIETSNKSEWQRDRLRDAPKATIGRRSLRKRELIADAVVTVLSEVGISGLTHRRVAKAAGISLSATTYHFASKDDMLADAAHILLAGYLASLRRSAKDNREGRRRDSSLGAFVTRILLNSAGRYRQKSLAWCEIILDAARSPEGHCLATQWFEELEGEWGELFTSFGVDASPPEVQVAIDAVIGLMFITLGLGISEAAMSTLQFDGGVEILETLQLFAVAPNTVDRSLRPKAERTRAQIIEATIRILNRSGAGAVSYRSVAEESGVALTAPAYYFGSIGTLIQVAEAELFQASKLRYRQLLSITNPVGLTAEQLADVTSAILIREATEFRSASLAHYSVWLEAARTESIRPAVAAAVLDQARAWERRIWHLERCHPGDGLYFQALFIGQHIRCLATGAPIPIMAGLRAQFLEGLSRPPVFKK